MKVGDKVRAVTDGGYISLEEDDVQVIPGHLYEVAKVYGVGGAGGGMAVDIIHPDIDFNLHMWANEYEEVE